MKKDALKKIVEAHRKWMNNEADGERADLSGADLSYADLRGADLSYADLRRANLSGAKGLLDAINYMEAHFERTTNG